jgi:hypothetical protein
MLPAHDVPIYLTVFDHNARAKSFYSRHGFVEVEGVGRDWRDLLAVRLSGDSQGTGLIK